MVVDFLSLDIEGGEYNVLLTIDFTKIYIKILAIELAYKEMEDLIKPYLQKQGFMFLCRKGADGIFINKKAFNKTTPFIIKTMVKNRIFNVLKYIALLIHFRDIRKFFRKN